MMIPAHPEPFIVPLHLPVPESMSRTIDKIVSAQEMPYGYAGDGPPYDTGNFNQAAKEEKRWRPGGGNYG